MKLVSLTQEKGILFSFRTCFILVYTSSNKSTSVRECMCVCAYMHDIVHVCECVCVHSNYFS